MPVVPFDPRGQAQPQGNSNPGPSDTDLMVGAAMLHSEGKLIKPEPPQADISGWRWPWQSKPEPFTDAPEHPAQDYPTSEDVTLAQKSGLAYGKSWENYFQGRIARVYTEPTGPGGAREPTALFQRYVGDKDFMKKIGADLLKNRGSDIPMSQLYVQDPQAFGEINKMVGQAGIASGRDPIASMGFDPAHMEIDIKSRATSLRGETTTDKDEQGKTLGPPESAINLSSQEQAGSFASMLHEAIHRGFARLRDRSAEFDDLQKQSPTHGGTTHWLAAEEHYVRRIMKQTMGNPEEASNASRVQQSDAYMKDPEAQRILVKLQSIAAKEFMKEHPGGPR